MKNDKKLLETSSHINHMIKNFRVFEFTTIIQHIVKCFVFNFNRQSAGGHVSSLNGRDASQWNIHYTINTKWAICDETNCGSSFS